jgi:hypothetical protein
VADVFINPDLSPLEAKEAFERRQQRRTLASAIQQERSSESSHTEPRTDGRREAADGRRVALGSHGGAVGGRTEGTNGYRGASDGRREGFEGRRREGSDAPTVRDFTVWNSARFINKSDQNTRNVSNLIVCAPSVISPQSCVGLGLSGAGNTLQSDQSYGGAAALNSGPVASLDPRAADFRPASLLNVIDPSIIGGQSASTLTAPI